MTGGLIARAALVALAVSGLGTFAATRAQAAAGPGCDALVGGRTVSEGVQGWSDPHPGTGYVRSYCLHLPPNRPAGREIPLVMVLHGCTTWAPTAAYESRFNAEADRLGFAVVYPQQNGAFSASGPAAHPYDGNGSYCWNWFLPDQLRRDSPEPWLLHDIAEKVIAGAGIDRHRVYVIGASAGGAEADLMAALYPDLFAAVAVVAGCQYDGAACLGSTSALPPQASGYLAHQAAGAHARVMPYLVENGDADPVVPVHNAYDVVLQWQTYDALAAGAAPAPVAPCAATASAPPSPDQVQVTDPSDPLNTPDVPHAYDTLYYQGGSGAACDATPADLGQLLIVHGEGHAWPGGPARREYTTEDGYWDIWTDPLSPNLTDLAWRFFAAHPCRLQKGMCV